MSLILAINSFNWPNDAVKDAFMLHLLGPLGTTATTTGVKVDSSVSTMTVPELKEECKRLNIRGVTGKSKKQLIEMITNHDPSKVKVKKDKTKPVTVSPDFIKAEFVQKFQADPDSVKPLELKRAIKAFEIKNPEDESKPYKTFGASKADMVPVLQEYLGDRDPAEFSDTPRAGEDSDSPPARFTEESDDSSDSGVEESKESEMSDEEKAKAAKKAAKKAKKAAKKAAAEKEAEPEPEPEPEPTKKPKRRSKKSKGLPQEPAAVPDAPQGGDSDSD